MFVVLALAVIGIIGVCMATTYGQSTTGTGGRQLSVLTNPELGRWKPGGITIDWSTVTAEAADATLDDGRVVKAGDKYIRYGTIMSKITASGKYGPADTAAADGRETVTEAKRGNAFILNRTVLYSELHSDHIGDVFDEGVVFSARLNVGGAGQPTLANARTMFPAISPID